MRKDAQALAHARTYLGEHHAFTISIITRYEVLRGLKAVGAAARVEKFDRLCETCEVFPTTDAIVGMLPASLRDSEPVDIAG
ncbi:MAG: hypothetical protein U0166_25530 [Acidobacteriota bacterium]